MHISHTAKLRLINAPVFHPDDMVEVSLKQSKFHHSDEYRRLESSTRQVSKDKPMLEKFNDIQIRYKLWALIFLMSLGTGALILISLFSLHSSMLTDRQERTRNLVEVGYSTINHYYQLSQSGEMTENQAQVAAIEMVRSLRYDEEEYFWINDMKARMLMHATKPELEGQDLSQMKDPGGIRIFSEFVNLVKKEGEGFLDYQWPKPGHKNPVDKSSFVKGFQPWNWVIGSGVYMDEMAPVFVNTLIQYGIAVGILSVVIGGVALFIIQLVTQRVSRLQQIMMEVEESGDLRQRVDFSSADELGSMASSFNKMMGAFQNIVKEVSASSRQLDGIVLQTNELSQRTSEGAQVQLRDTESTASAMLEMAASAQETTSIAEKASLAANQVKEQSSQGLTVISITNSSIQQLAGEVANATETIHNLRNFVTQIETILDVISGVSEQTSLLALNAAIEAARAGEQGRGFAVVADEVRNLAQRSQASTKEIHDMIDSLRQQTLETVEVMETAQRKAEEGVAQSNQAGDTFRQIASGIEDISNLNGQIMVAASEQSRVAEQISQSITNIAGVSEQTAGDTSRIRHSVDELDECAEQLGSLIHQFTT